MKKLLIFPVILVLTCVAACFQTENRSSEKDSIESYTSQADAFYNADDYESAIKYYELELSECGPDSGEVGIIYSKLGNCYYELGNHDNALFYYLKALLVQKEVVGENNLDTATIYTNIGSIYDNKGDYDSAFFYYQRALSMDEIALQSVEWYVSEGDVYEEFSDYERALESYEKGLELQKAHTGENHIYIFSIYQRIGYLYYEQNILDLAYEYFYKALNVGAKILEEDDVYFTNLYYHLSNVCGDMGDYKNAIIYGEKSLEIQIKHDNTETEQARYRILRIYNSLSLFHLYIGNFDNALGYALKALNFAEQFLAGDSYNIPTFYDNVGGVYKEKGDYEAAFKYFSMASDMRLKNNSDFLGLAFSYNNIGQISAALNDLDNALKFYFRAIENYEKANYLENPYIATVYSNIANCLNMQEKYKDAEMYNQKSLSLREKYLGEKHPETAISYVNIAWNYYDQKDFTNSVAYWKKAYAIWENSTNYNDVLTDLNDIAFSAVPDPDFTRETLALAADTVERARLDLSSMKSDIMRKSLPIYYYGVQFETEQNNPEKSFEYSESLRSRGFLDQLGTETALKLDGVTDEEKKQVQELLSKITMARKTIEEQNSMAVSERDEKRLSDAGAELASAEKSLLKLDEKIGKRIPSYAQLRNPKPVSTGDAQKWCGKKRAVLEYVLWNPELSSDGDAKIKSYCIILTNKKVSVVELDGEYDYTAAVNKLRDGIKSIKRESQFEKARNGLYEKLISPVLPCIPGGVKELVIVPDGNLSFLPFDVLRKDEDSKMLGDKYAVALSPSISVSVLSGKKKTDERKMLAFGGAWYDTRLSPEEHRAEFSEEGIMRGAKRGAAQVDFNLETQNDAELSYVKNDIKENGPRSYFDAKNLRWQDLPGTITELKALKDKVFNADSFSEIVQEDASEKTVKRLSSEGTLAMYPILHFACHGYFDNKISDMSSVLFSEVSGALKDSADDGYLTISETALLNLNADLVCLSACETGLGEMKVGDGMVGLTRAFMVAGAQQVGASLWCVDDDATAKFMSSMYEKVVKNGMNYADAYQKTKAEFRKDEDFEHPYYWSAFVLYE